MSKKKLISKIELEKNCNELAAEIIMIAKDELRKLPKHPWCAENKYTDMYYNAFKNITRGFMNFLSDILKERDITVKELLFFVDCYIENICENEYAMQNALPEIEMDSTDDFSIVDDETGRTEFWFLQTTIVEPMVIKIIKPSWNYYNSITRK